MTNDDIIRMARKAELAYGPDEKPLESVLCFAALVASHEREACAQLLERTDLSAFKDNINAQVWFGKMLMGFADAIRARGQK